jgi:hypothetical protein
VSKFDIDFEGPGQWSKLIRSSNKRSVEQGIDVKRGCRIDAYLPQSNLE